MAARDAEPNEPTEPPSDKLSTSGRSDSSITERMLGEPPMIIGEGADKLALRGEGRTGREKDGSGPGCEVVGGSGAARGLLYMDMLSSVSGVSDRGNGK
jgi:hypothetical protein